MDHNGAPPPRVIAVGEEPPPRDGRVPAPSSGPHGDNQHRTGDAGAPYPRMGPECVTPSGGDAQTEKQLPGLSRCRLWDKVHTMSDDTRPAPISDPLRRTIAQAVEGGRTNYKALERETGVTRASIMRFVRGTQSLHLGMADRLAAHFGLELRPKRKVR